MPAPRSHRRARLAVLVSLVLAVTGFQFFLAPTAQAASGTGLVISEVYGGGGNSGAAVVPDRLRRAVQPDRDRDQPRRAVACSTALRRNGTRRPSASWRCPTRSVPAGGYYLVAGERPQCRRAAPRCRLRTRPAPRIEHGCGRRGRSSWPRARRRSRRPAPSMPNVRAASSTSSARDGLDGNHAPRRHRRTTADPEQLASRSAASHGPTPTTTARRLRRAAATADPQHAAGGHATPSAPPTLGEPRARRVRTSRSPTVHAWPPRVAPAPYT